MDAGLQAADWQRLSALFDELADLPAPERARRLGAVQPPELAARLARMLASLPDDDATVVLDVPGYDAGLAAALGTPGPSAVPLPQPGDRLGAWCLAELLGEGGMGQVWRAERADGLYQGEAAIKLLREDLTSPGLAARFARERALLGRLTHPNIARLLDAGEQHGRAFLVLEYVAGKTLSEHVREHKLPLAGRVRLLIEVARAVEHAHAQLIVHRDLKPSNVMLDESGGTKLLDFGIAGLLDDSGQQADSQLTQVTGRRLTPAYAAPEQITGDGIGVAADIYSLGVMLYELASGQLPFGRQGRGRTALEHDVLHTEARRITQALEAPDLGDGDAGPGRPPDARKAAGDLEAVAAKAMRKNPEERYASVGSFVEDLERWLRQRPVSVRAEDWRHRMHLWVRRNAALAAGGALVLAALSLGLGVSLWQRDEAQAAARQSEEVTHYLTDLLASANPERHGGRIPNIFDLLEKSRVELRERFAHDDLTYARVLEVMASTYDDMNRQDISIPLYRDLVEVHGRLWGDDDPRTIASQLRLARAFTAIGSPMEVVEIGERVLPKLPPKAGEGDYENLLYQLLVAYANLGRFDEAEAVGEKAWALKQQIYKPTDYEYVFFNLYIYVLRTNQGRWLDAEAVMQPLVEAGAHAPPHRARFVQRSRQGLWVVQARLGRPQATTEAALALAADMDALLGRGNSSSQRMYNDLARHQMELGDASGAVRTQAQLAAILPEAAARNPNQRLPREAQALLAQALDSPKRAELLPRARTLAAELRSGKIPAGPPWVDAMTAIVRVGLVLNDLALAQDVLVPLQQMQSTGWMRNFDAWRTRVGQLDGELQRARGRPQDGVQALRERVAYLDRLPAPQGLPHWRAQLDLAASLVAARSPDAAQALARADALRPEWLAPHHPMDALRAQLGQGGSAASWSGQF
ncbi:protein kinase domain-containing protein [Roseateles sp.]|uniref:serine/threonine-protein kinase n=1 Tax=Roseateles sp. TaxID=1971397 RepID=UPI003BABE998